MIQEYGYEYHAVKNGVLLAEAGWRSTDSTLWGAYCMRSGRDALKAIARMHAGARVYLPALCCNSMITPFESYRCEIVFYPLTEALTADYPALCRLMEDSRGDTLLLYYDYFGIPMLSPDGIRELRTMQRELSVIRDTTHTLLADGAPSPLNDYTVASLRKWTSLPDGGLLFTERYVAPAEWREDSRFAEQRLEAQVLRTRFFETGDGEIKCRYRQMFASVSEFLDSEPHPVRMTEYSYRLAALTDWEALRRTRRENADLLREAFRNADGIHLIDDGARESNLYVPILVENRDEIQALLSRKGIFNTVIWPLREAQMQACENAAAVSKKMLAVPCDQRYSKEDILHISREITRTVHEKNNDSRC